MGMFTTIILPNELRKIHIYTGDDSCDTYTIGDKVNNHINPNWYGSGCCFDGVYAGNFDDTGKYCIVMIQNGRVDEIIENRWKSDEEFYDEYHEYEEKYPIKILWRNYTYKAIFRHIVQEIKWKIRGIFSTIKNKRIRKNFINIYGEKEGLNHYLAYIITIPISEPVGYNEIAKKCMIIEPFPEGKLFISEK